MRIATGHCRRLMVIVLLAALVYCVIQVLRSELSFNDNDISNSEKLMHISQLIKNSAKHNKLDDDDIQQCKLPELDVNNPEILKFIHDVPPIKCTPEDWVIADGSQLIIQEKAKKHHGQITCAFRVNDDTIKLSDAYESDELYSLSQSDFVDVKCESQQGEQWHSVLAGVRDDPIIKKTMTWENVPEGGLNLNVLMFGFDSLSRNTFIRKLPKTYGYLTKNLNVQVLEGYNIIGDGTPQALIPILTGKIELELPETRKRMGAKANYVDVYPMIWKKFKDSGYITGFMEDVAHIGTFTYRLKGFKEQPTDHYMRSYYLAAAPYFKNSKKFCMGGIPRHKVMMNYITNIFDTYRDNPKFVFGFHGELSHDSYNDIGAADDDLNDWIKQLQDHGHLNNTLLILMSDHGHRFADIRNTLAGKQEERLPFFSFVFPSWFKQVHPKAYANIVYNIKRLSTPFDIHKTLESILKMETPMQGDTSQRDISLFNEIPSYRTCADAFIEPHWCACLSWQEMSTTDPIIIAAANSFINFLNSYTEEHRNICHVLHLGQIIWSAKLIPTKGLLTFKKSGDLDGFMGDFSAKTAFSHETYQIKVKTQPGEGLFEASIEYDVTKNIFNIKISDVSRINKYGSQARCVENDFFHLRKYCNCKN
ncbi:hypothetical protein PV325_013870 [Microctonus aethiopoides]|nr:hypothetical protein PV325_013870 [Microctonus aethiopoides]KAK0098030.1 hypothetical protein PV326_011703 [Microctonus aethiopoides]